MRLPNQYGSITKLSGKRRNPYMILLHIGKDPETGKRTRKPLSYHRTYKEAFDALKKYNEKPYDVTKVKLTFSDVYDRWYEPHCKGKSDSLKHVYAAAYKSLFSLHEMVFEDIRPYHIDAVFSSFVSSRPKKRQMATLLGLLYTHARKLDIVDRDYSEFIELGEVKEAEIKNIYSDFEIRRLSKIQGLIPDSLIFMIYTGLRIGEFLSLETAKIDLQEMTIRSGIKTDAGKNRLIPLHPVAQKILLKYYDSTKTYLIERDGSQMKYRHFSDDFKELMVDIGMNHTIHETRHTFITKLDELNAKDHLVKMLVGHAQKDFTKKVYTHATITQLRDTVNLLSNF